MSSSEHTAALSSKKKFRISELVTVSSQCLPLVLVNPGREVRVKSIRGKDEVRRFLESLGFVEGAGVTVISEMGGNVIVNVKGTRVAISHTMASRILTN